MQENKSKEMSGNIPRRDFLKKGLLTTGGIAVLPHHLIFAGKKKSLIKLIWPVLVLVIEEGVLQKICTKPAWQILLHYAM